MRQELIDKIMMCLAGSGISDNDISQEFIEYALPLIKGEIKANYQSGIVRFSKLDKTKVKLD